MAESNFFEAVFDITTTEVADHLFGGVLPCTDDRFGAFIRSRIPYVGSVGAVDMVNFGARDTVPAKYADRKFHVHNAHVTLMRTTPDEIAAIGRFIVERLNQMQGPVRFPAAAERCVCHRCRGPGVPQPRGRQGALFDAVRQGWVAAPNRKLIEIDAHINDAAFADAAVSAFNEIT